MLSKPSSVADNRLPAWIQQRKLQGNIHSVVSQLPVTGALAPITQQQSEQILHACQQLLDEEARQACHNGIDPEQLEQLFVRGMHAYQDGQYHAALPDFATVALYRPLNPRHYMALASSLQQLTLYRDALTFYAYALMLRPDDPGPMFRMGECLLMLDDLNNARELLQGSLILCESDSRNATLAAHIKQLLASLH